MEKREKDILVELKECYESGLVSALVGAGFSKNVSNQFLSWGELLYDMIGELYETDINCHYDNYLHQNRSIVPDLKDEKEVRKEYIKEITQKEDYLDIVSKYIKKKGYRECVEYYIEERTPYAQINKDGKIVIVKGSVESEEIPEGNFSAHKELLRAKKLRNIYTTNYENLIEFAAEQFKKELSLDKTYLVANSQELSDKVHFQKIIKIHGNLRKSTDEKIQFDGDNALCYIIAKEDYDSYMEMHAAFADLMRTTMLEGKFMLLGFSGTDKNYKGWVRWIKNILDREPENINKIYIIDVSGKPIAPELKCYHSNNHIAVINLFTHDKLAYIGFKDDEIADLFKHELTNDDKRNILTVFLRFLNAKTVNTDNSSKDSDNNYSLKLKSGLALSEIRPNAYSYRKLWNEASAAVSNNENIDICADRIKLAKQLNIFPKVVYNQDNIIDELLRKTKISNSEAYLLALAIDECGLNPHYYSRLIHDYEELDKLPLWNLLKVKEETFNGATIMLSGNDDASVYENIQRLLFQLNFKEANNKIKRWNPNGNFIIAKAMRLASIKDQKEKAFNLLASYIKKEDNPLLQLYAIQIANYISDSYPQPYNTEEFYRYGIDGIGDNLDFMLQQLRGKFDNPRARGWIGSTMNFGGCYPEYEKSIRILRYISDTGLYLNYGFTYFFDKASWYHVFKNLYEEFPYPCFFYSIQYRDNDLQTRIGQDFAYSQKLSEFNKDILVRAIKAYGDDSTPQLFLQGLLNVIAPIYIAVNENLWFDVFKEHIFKKLTDNFDKYDISDTLIKNIKHALVSLKDSHNIIYILKELLRNYCRNRALADSFIRDNLQIKYIRENVPNEIWALLKGLITDYPNTDITGLIFFMEDNELMTQEIKDAFIDKIIATEEEKLPQGRSTSFYLCLLTKENPPALVISKKLLLKHDVWNCGITEDGKGWSNPGYIRLNAFQNRIEWTEDEFNYISNNLKNNITKYDQLHNHLHRESFMRNVQVAYLSDIISFIDGLSDERKRMLQDIRIKVENLLNNRISYKSLIEGMLSEQSVDADFAMDNVVQGIKANGLLAYLNEFNFILDRAIVGDGLIINSVLQKIRVVVEKFPEQIISANLCSKLHTIISLYKERWSTYKEFKPMWSFNHLYMIADFLKKNGCGDSEAVSYWLNDSFVQIFIRL